MIRALRGDDIDPTSSENMGLSTYADMAAFDSFVGRPDREVCVVLSRRGRRWLPARPPRAATSQRALDWFSFFLADIQTGFGPFVAVYLSANAWTQGEIGLVLTVGGLVALAGQMPAGALVDAIRSARVVATLAIVAISISALALALWPIFPVVISARILHAGASCILGPVIAALSLAVAGHAGFGERLGRNARFASLGAGIAAAAMGAFGQFLSTQSVFLLTAALALPAIFALARIRTAAPTTAIEPLSRGSAAGERADSAVAGAIGWRKVLTDRRLLIFAACVVLFHLSNAGMLPLMGGILARRGTQRRHQRHRRLHDRTANHRCRRVAFCRKKGGALGPTSASARMLCRASDARCAICAGQQSLFGGCGAAAGRRVGGSVGRDVPADHRRHHAQHGSVQSCARRSRQRDGDRGGAQHHARWVRVRPRRRYDHFFFARRDCSARPWTCLARDAGNPPQRRIASSSASSRCCVRARWANRDFLP